MGGLFSKKSQKTVQQPTITEQDRAVLQLKQQRDRLTQNRRRIEDQMNKQREIARKLLESGQKTRALLLLRRKKMLERQLDQIEGILEKVEQLTHDLEFAQVQVDVVNSLKQGNAALKAMNDLLKYEDVEKLMEDSREAAEYQQEIANLLSGGLSNDDEEDVEAQLEELLRNENVEHIGRLPDVPKHRTVSPTKTTERVLVAAD